MLALEAWSHPVAAALWFGAIALVGAVAVLVGWFRAVARSHKRMVLGSARVTDLPPGPHKATDAASNVYVDGSGVGFLSKSSSAGSTSGSGCGRGHASDDVAGGMSVHVHGSEDSLSIGLTDLPDDILACIFYVLLDVSSPACLHGPMRLVCHQFHARLTNDSFWKQAYSSRWFPKSNTFLSWNDMYVDRHELEIVHDQKVAMILATRKVQTVKLSVQEESSFRSFFAGHSRSEALDRSEELHKTDQAASTGPNSIGAPQSETLQPSQPQYTDGTSMHSNDDPTSQTLHVIPTSSATLLTFFEERNSSLSKLLDLMRHNQMVANAEAAAAVADWLEAGSEGQPPTADDFQLSDYPVQADWEENGVINLDSFLELNRLRKGMAYAEFLSRKALSETPPETSVRLRLLEEAHQQKQNQDDDGSGIGMGQSRRVMVDIDSQFVSVHVQDEVKTEGVFEDLKWKDEEANLTCCEKLIGPIFLFLELIAKKLGECMAWFYRCLCVIEEEEEQRLYLEMLRRASVQAIVTEEQRKEQLQARRQRSDNEQLETAIDTATAAAIRLLQMKAQQDGKEVNSQFNLDAMRQIIDGQVAEIVNNTQQVDALRKRRMELEASVRGDTTPRGADEEGTVSAHHAAAGVGTGAAAMGTRSQKHRRKPKQKQKKKRFESESDTDDSQGDLTTGMETAQVHGQHGSQTVDDGDPPPEIKEYWIESGQYWIDSLGRKRFPDEQSAKTQCEDEAFPGTNTNDSGAATSHHPNFLPGPPSDDMDDNEEEMSPISPTSGTVDFSLLRGARKNDDSGSATGTGNPLDVPPPPPPAPPGADWSDDSDSDGSQGPSAPQQNANDGHEQCQKCHQTLKQLGLANLLELMRHEETCDAGSDVSNDAGNVDAIDDADVLALFQT